MKDLTHHRDHDVDLGRASTIHHGDLDLDFHDDAGTTLGAGAGS